MTEPIVAERLTAAVKTWRYLRLAMVALAVGLAVAVYYEWRQVTGHCFQTSISAYYYTPVRGYFTAALLSIGVCLFCLKGSTEAEDVLLNLAGMFATVVALVPTPGTGRCATLLGTTEGRDLNIENNVVALIAVGGVGVFVFALLWWSNRPRGPIHLGYLIGAVFWGAAIAWFLIDRPTFVDNAHNVAAYSMFGCILVAVWVNAFHYRRPMKSLWNPYTLVGSLMVLSAVVIGAARLIGDWRHWVIAIEASFILLFAIFWVIQTKELWREGLRPPTPQPEAS